MSKPRQSLEGIIKTPRLVIRLATLNDAPFLHRLWQDGRVMANVGFPNGLGMTVEEIKSLLKKRQGLIFGGNLIATLNDGEAIGEAFMSKVDESGVAFTDVKLLPEFWGHGYGREIKVGLCQYMFDNIPDLMAIKADPHRKNLPSIKMQLSVGGIPIVRGGDYPIDVDPYFPDDDSYQLFMVFRDNFIGTLPHHSRP